VWGRGRKVGEEEEEAAAHGLLCQGAASQAQKKEQNLSKWEVSLKKASARAAAGFLWLGPPLVLFTVHFCTQIEARCSIKKTRK